MATITATARTSIAAQIKEIQKSTRPLDRVIRFFVKYRPSTYSALRTGQAVPTPKQRIIMGLKPISSKNLPQASALPAVQNQTAIDSTTGETEGEVQNDTLPTITTTRSSRQTSSAKNPFLPSKNHRTGRWYGPEYGLRRQAELCKCARELGVEALLPASIKSSTYRQQRALERGLAVKGTGEGQRVKGHKWERQMAGTLEKRRKAMEGMPELIREWEQRGHGRGWKKYPR